MPAHRRKTLIPIATEIRNGTRAQGAELQAADVGRILLLGGGFGVVQAADVGRRVWVRSWGLAMESKDQRDARRLAPVR